MSRKTYDYAQCNGCFKEQRIREATGLGGRDRLPDGWVEVHSADGNRLWDLCDGCFKEVSALLFAKERIDRVIEGGREASTT